MHPLVRSTAVQTVRRATARPAFVWDMPRVQMERLEPRYLYAASLDILGTTEHIAFTQPLNDGGVLIGGEAFRSRLDGPQIPENALLVRLNADLSPDTRFGGGDGVVTLGDSWMASAAHEMADGSIIVIGQPYNAQMGGMYDAFRVYKLKADGSLDASFDGDGMRLMSGGEYTGWFNLDSTPDGKIVIGTSDGTARGSGNNNGDGHVFVLNADGSSHTGFDGDGHLVINMHRTGIWNSDAVSDLKVLADGRMLVAVSRQDRIDSPQGNTIGYEQHNELWMLDANGRFDTTFGVGGKVSVYKGPHAWGPMVRIDQGADGSIYVFNSSLNAQTGGTTGWVLRKLALSGTWDAGFGVGGRVERTLTYSEEVGHLDEQPTDFRFVKGQILVVLRGELVRDYSTRTYLSDPAVLRARGLTFSTSGAPIAEQLWSVTSNGNPGPAFTTMPTLMNDGSVVGVAQLSDYQLTAEEMQKWASQAGADAHMKVAAYARLFATRFGEALTTIPTYTAPPVFPGGNTTPVPPAQPTVPHTPTPPLVVPVDPAPVDPAPMEPEPSPGSGDADPVTPGAVLPGGAGNDPTLPSGFPTPADEIFASDDDDILGRLDPDAEYLATLLR